MNGTQHVYLLNYYYLYVEIYSYSFLSSQRPPDTVHAISNTNDNDD
jgi:hypothetical protein